MRGWRRPEWGWTRPTSTATACKRSSSPTSPSDHATLYQNNGATLVLRHQHTLGLKVLTYETLKWGCAFLDYDNDGDLDIVIANGHIYPQVDEAPECKESYRQRPTLLGTTAGRLTDVRARPGPGCRTGLGPWSGRRRL